MILKTNLKLYGLRHVNNKDIDILYKWRNHRLIRNNMIDNRCIQYESHIKWFKKNKKSENTELLILNFKNKEIGFGSIHDINKSNKTSTWGMYLNPNLLNLSHGFYLEYLLITRMFYFHKIDKIYGHTLSNNENVLKLHRFLSFKIEGILKKQIIRKGVSIDVIITSLFKKDWENNKISKILS